MLLSVLRSSSGMSIQNPYKRRRNSPQIYIVPPQPPTLNYILAYDFQIECKEQFYKRACYKGPCRANYNTQNHRIIQIQSHYNTRGHRFKKKSLYIHIFLNYLGNYTCTFNILFFNITKNGDRKQGSPSIIITSSSVWFLYWHAWGWPRYRPKHVAHM